ncbi:MAG TPA: class I SAM-dependent methyltransferase [Dehalococcoidales bacterium]|nr:class I SAM-dependent methyltransferase [Dehalococcoidales bacterium]
MNSRRRTHVPDEVTDIQAYYDQRIDREDGRLAAHQLERDMTWRYLDKYLPSRGKILELGAAAGAYTIPLAKRGYNITAIDLSPKLLEICRQKVIEEKLEKQVTCLVADARDLSKVGRSLFDVVLIMGPLYHLVFAEDRLFALKQAHGKLKREGLIFSTFISRYGLWGDVMKGIPHYINYRKDVFSVLKHGKDAEFARMPGNFRGYFATVPEIGPLHKRAGFKKILVAGIEPGVPSNDENYNRLEPELKRLWLDLLFSISTENSILGASRHILYIGKRL